MSDLAIETQHLRRRFGEKLAVADLSLNWDVLDAMTVSLGSS